jgi:hypothetical protein
MVTETPESARIACPGRWRAYTLHGLLLAVIVAECVAARVFHRSAAELAALRETGSPTQQAYALFVSTNRGDPLPVEQRAVRQILQSANPLVREWTMTTNFVRLAPPRVQEDHIAALGGAPEALRCSFFLRYRIGLGQSMTLAELRRFFDALRAGS